MKKENKKLAQQRRAKDRKKQKVLKIVKPICFISIPSILLLAFIYVIVANPFKIIRNGDTVNIDYVGTIDGVEFEGGTDEDFDLTIGSNTFIDGFEEQLIWHRPGDTFDVEVTFPKDYHSADVAGKDAVFKVTINEIVE